MTPPNFIGALAVTALLGGCATVGPDYRKPAPATLQATGGFVADPLLAERRAIRPAPELATWWEGFGDPDLSRIVGRAASENLDIAIARARLDRAAAAVRLARAEQMPSVGVQGQAAVQRQSLEGQLGPLVELAPGFERTFDSYSLGASASWEIDLFGGARRGREAATAEAQAAYADLAAARVTVIAEAVDAYLQLRLLQQRQAILSEQIAAAASLDRLARDRIGAGLAAAQEGRRTSAQLRQLEAGLPVIEAAAAAQLNRLDVLMGARPGTYRAELAALRPVPTPPTLASAGEAGDLLRRRPDLLAAERRLAASNARIGRAIAEYYPKISLSGLLGFEALDPGRLLTGDALTASLTGGLRWRLFDFGRIDAQVAEARGAEREAMASYRQLVLRAVEEVETAIVALVRREAQARKLAQAESDLVAARDSSRAAYRAGDRRLDETLDVERQLLAVRDERALANAENARAAVAVFRALGGGWQPRLATAGDGSSSVVSFAPSEDASGQLGS